MMNGKIQLICVYWTSLFMENTPNVSEKLANFLLDMRRSATSSSYSKPFNFSLPHRGVRTLYHFGVCDLEDIPKIFYYYLLKDIHLKVLRRTFTWVWYWCLSIICKQDHQQHEWLFVNARHRQDACKINSIQFILCSPTSQMTNLPQRA